jgi:pimeloyl-ACP methyl ester carboxylesterase
MAGDKDEIKTEHTVKIFENIPNAQLAIVPNATHYLPRDNPKLFNEIILRFLKEE